MWRFRRTLDARVVAGTLFVLSDTGSVFYQDVGYVQVAELLDGTRSAGQIAEALADQMDGARVLAVLRRLYRDGHIVRDPVPTGPAGLYVEGLGIRTRGFAQALAAFRVAVVAGGQQTSAECVVDALRLLGCDAESVHNDVLPDADLTVVLTEDHLCPDLDQVNTARLADGREWMLVKPRGQEVWVGPRFIPHVTGCWRCLAVRVNGNRQVERFVARQLGFGHASVPAVGLLPGVDGMVAAMIGAEVLAIVGGGPSTLAGRMRTVRLADFHHQDHHLIRSPFCAACGDPSLARRNAATVPSRIRSSPGFGADWRRVLTAEAVGERLDPLVGPRLGVVSGLTPVPRGGYTTGHTVVAGHDFPMLGRNPARLRRNLRGHSAGRGRTVEQARAGALCEAVERYAGIWVDGADSTRCGWQELDRRAVHPAEVMLYSARQYATRAGWNIREDNVVQWVPEPFDESWPISFTEGWSLTRSEPVLIPSGLVWYGHPDLEDHAYAATDSNGCAAGGSLAEATLHGLCELHERDAVAIWWYNRLSRPGIDLDALADPYVDELRRTYARHQREVWVLDISTDLAMPCCAAISRRDHAIEDVVFGFGAHPDPVLAVRAALMEMDQLVPLVVGHDDHGATRYATRDPAALRWFQTVTCRFEPWLRPRAGAPTVLSDALVDPTAPASQVLDFYVQDLRRAGIEAIVVDQTRPDIDLHVVRVLAPGMRHFWRRTAPGRLFDVPVRLGWRPTPTPEEELNRWSVFL